MGDVMRKGLLLFAVLSASCSLFTETNPSYCSRDSQCTEPMVCNLQKHGCELQEARADDPTITAISPSAGSRAGGFEITITGTHFDQVEQVQFAEVAGGNLTVRSSTELVVTVPPGPGLCGLTTLTLRTRDGRAVKDSTHFRYRAANVQLSVTTGGSVGPVGSNPGSLLPIRPNSTDSDDLLIGYLAPIVSFSHVQVNGSGRNQQETMMARPPVDTEIKKMRLANGAPGGGPILLLGNLTDRIWAFLGSVNGVSFTVSSEQPVVPGYVDFAVGDFDKDGKSELAVLRDNGASSSVVFYYSNVSGNYTTSTAGPMALGVRAHLAVHDANRDGLDDIVLAAKTGATIDLLTNNRTSAFQGPTPYTAISGGNDLIIADMDLDGFQDMVVFGSGTASDAAASIFYNYSAGGYNIVQLGTVTGNVNRAVVADFDCDGLPDLVTHDGIGLKFYANTGASTQFGLPVDLGMYNITAMAAGLFTSDRQADIALLQQSCNEVSPGSGCLRFLGNGSN